MIRKDVLVATSLPYNTTKGGSRRLKKSHTVWMMMMIAASLMWARAAEREHECERQREQPKLALKTMQMQNSKLGLYAHNF